MNFALYKQMLKVHAKTIFSYSIGSAFYLLLIVAIYPSIAGSKAMEKLLKQMPEQWLKAFGFNTGMGNMTEFIAGEYYSLLFILILSVYCIMTANQLMARLIDRGSMSYLLATPNSRQKIAFTQALVLLTGLVAIVLVTTIAGIAGDKWLVSNYSLNRSSFFEMNLVGLLLFFAISGYSFFFSAIVNDEKQALALSAGVTFLFYCFDLVGKIADKVEWLRNLSLFSAFRPSEIAQGNVELLPVCSLLFSLGMISYIAAILIFSKRDLVV